MVKIQKIVFTILALFVVSGVFAQTKKKSSSKKKPPITIQKPADAPAKVAEQVTTPEVVVPQTPTAVPMAEREQIIIPEQPITLSTQKNSNIGAAEKVIFDSLSVHPIDPSNILYRITNWRRMDLKEKINQPFFSKNTEITKFLMDGVRTGVLTAYTNDSVNTVLSLEGFAKNLQMEDTGSDGLSEEEKAAGFGTEVGGDDGWGNTKPSTTTPKGTKPATGAGADDGWGNTTTPAKTTAGTAAPAGTAPTGIAAVSTALEYFARDLTILEIKEDYIFDKQRSRAYNSIQVITIVIPAEKTVRGFNVPVASFRYKDLDQYFRSNPKCIWYNFKNTAQHKNMADAFDLRLFNARIIKQSNPSDSFLVDLYKGEKGGLRASEQLEYKLMEFEHNLWEY